MNAVTPAEIPHTIAVVYAEDQAEYTPLPVRRNDAGEVTSEWEPDAAEMSRLLETWASTGKIRVRITLLTFNNPLQPMRVEVP